MFTYRDDEEQIIMITVVSAVEVVCAIVHINIANLIELKWMAGMCSSGSTLGWYGSNI